MDHIYNLQSGWLLDYSLVEEEIKASNFIYMVDCSSAVRWVSAWPLFNAFIFIVSYAFGYRLGHYDGPCSKSSSRPATATTLTASITIPEPSISESTAAPSSTTTTDSTTSHSPVVIWSLMQQTRGTSPGSTIIVVNQTQRCRNGL